MDLKFRVHRNFTESSSDHDGILKLHQERSAIIHDCVKEYNLDVKEWGNTDSETPREFVDIVIAFKNIKDIGDLLEKFQMLINKRLIMDFEISNLKGNNSISMRRARDQKISEIIKTLDLGTEFKNISVSKSKKQSEKGKKSKGSKSQQLIYFSYAWSDEKTERESFINKLYDSLSSKNYELVRDKMDLDYRGLISEFMKKIGKGNLIIVALSNKYLKSSYCMFELYEIYRNSKLEKKKFSKKIFPVRIESVDLKNPKTISKYLRFWDAKEKKWEKLIKEKADKIGKQQFAEYDKTKKIHASFSDLSGFIGDMNSLTEDLLSENDFEKVISSIDARLSKN